MTCLRPETRLLARGVVSLCFVIVIASVMMQRHLVEAATVAPPVGPPAGGVTAAPPAGTAGPPYIPPEPPFAAYIGDLCLNATHCTNAVNNSNCADAGDNSGKTRCRCQPGFYAYNTNESAPGDKHYINCGKLVTAVAYPACRRCEDNEGTCVLLNNGNTFCQCAISRSGSECEVIHANVSCTMFWMKICYSPHPYVNFNDGWRMYAAGQSKKPQCVGTEVNSSTTDHFCDNGNEELVLSLNETDLADCGTQLFLNSQNKRYQNAIEIQKFDSLGYEVTSSNPVVFNVYCSFTAYEDQTFPGMGVGRVNGNDRGDQVNPSLTFNITDQFGKAIPPGVTLMVGDLVKFSISVLQDVNYDSFRILRCTASTSPVMPDSTAETRALMNDGCPVPGEVTGNSWYWANSTVTSQSGQTFWVLTSGAVPIFKMSSSNYVYMHAALQMCMKGDTSCYPPKSPTTCSAAGRRKRDVDSAAEHPLLTLSRKKRAATDANVQTGYKVGDPNASPESQPVNSLSPGSSGFIALIVVLVIIALILIIAVTIFAVRMRRRSGFESDKPRPQLFALPRINRTHERF